MIILRSAHDLIVAELRRQIEDLKSERASALAEIREERDFYREQWTKLQGQPFPSATISPSIESRSEIELEAPPVDADWSEDDRDLFKSWILENVTRDMDPNEEWRRRYGTKTPIEALTV